MVKPMLWGTDLVLHTALALFGAFIFQSGIILTFKSLEKPITNHYLLATGGEQIALQGVVSVVLAVLMGIQLRALRAVVLGIAGTAVLFGVLVLLGWNVQTFVDEQGFVVWLPSLLAGLVTTISTRDRRRRFHQGIER